MTTTTLKLRPDLLISVFGRYWASTNFFKRLQDLSQTTLVSGNEHIHLMSLFLEEWEFPDSNTRDLLIAKIHTEIAIYTVISK